MNLAKYGSIYFLGMLWLSLFAWCGAVGAEESRWWPLPVKSHYGEYDPAGKRPGQAAPSLSRPKLEEWIPPTGRGNGYTLGVSFPHMKDPYWVAVNYGIITEAMRYGVGVKLVEAGGYENLDTQVKQLRRLAREGVDGIILGAISYQGNDAIIAELAQKNIPVVEVINDVSAPAVAAKALVSFEEMGYIAGEFVAEHAEKADLNTVHISFFPGPKNSGWAPESLEGLLAATEFFPGNVEVVDVRWGDTGFEEQRALIKDSLEQSPHVEYIVGNAVAALAATEVLEELGLSEKVTVVSTYIVPSLYDAIREGRVAAAPSDLTLFQGRMAVNMMIRVLDGETPGRDFPFRSGPFIPIVTPDNIDSYPHEGLFAPRDYIPIFNLEPKR